MVEAFEPASCFGIVVNLMLNATALALDFPTLEETSFFEHQVLFLRPFPKGGASGAVDRTEPTQLAELLRELWDFR